MSNRASQPEPEATARQSSQEPSDENASDAAADDTAHERTMREGDETLSGAKQDTAADAYERGAAMLTEIYQGEVAALPEGTMAFNDVMMRSLFAEVWGRDVLSIRDRRLLIMGVIAARGTTEAWKLQARSALKRGELSPDGLRETLITLAPYAGYPNVAPLIFPCETAISEWHKQ